MISASENVSSLPLQMAIYFNMYFFPWWLITTIVMLEAKVIRNFSFESYILQILNSYVKIRILGDTFVKKCVLFVFQFNQMSSLYQIIVVAIVVIFTIIEVIRLYLGFHGNLSEKASKLKQGLT